jgi:ferrochelatase
MSGQNGTGKIGVLLLNLGTPDAPDAGAVRRYLREFLSDRRVVEIPPIVWQPILRGAILTTRPRKSAHAYQQVWTKDGSPLAVFTRGIAEGLAGRFGDGVIVDWAMRYGNPDVAGRLRGLVERGCDRILIVPLYPQYCAATTATALDAAYAVLATMRDQPAIRTLPPYPTDPAYIGALAASTKAQLAALSFEPDELVASFHGMPERTRTLGDPYFDQCVATTRALEAALGRPIRLTFQSRFGRAKWLEPATDVTLVEMARKRGGNVAVLTPGFATDCLETLEEIAIRGRDDFLSAGGENFAHISCLNASMDAMNMYESLIGRQLSGWV